MTFLVQMMYGQNIIIKFDTFVILKSVVPVFMQCWAEVARWSTATGHSVPMQNYTHSKKIPIEYRSVCYRHSNIPVSYSWSLPVSGQSQIDNENISKYILYFVNFPFLTLPLLTIAQKKFSKSCENFLEFFQLLKTIVEGLQIEIKITI